MQPERISEIMVPLEKYPHIHIKDSARGIIRRFLCTQITVGDSKSLPRQVLVFNARRKLVGTVRRRDIMRALQPPFLSSKRTRSQSSVYELNIDPDLLELSYDKMLRGLKRRADQSVKSVMQPITHTVSSDDHIMKAIYLMTHHDISLLPVLTGEKVVGVVRSVDIFKVLADGVMKR